MNDWWNDPPEEPEIPGCPDCDIDLELDSSKDLICRECGYRISYKPDFSDADIERSQALIEEVLGPEEIAKLEEQSPLCPHGNEWGDCGKCDYEGDIAYDAARERRIR